MALPRLTQSESALATCREEQRFRIANPNSRPRDAVLISLDPASRRLIADLVAERPDRRRSFDLSRNELSDATGVQAWLATAAAQTTALSKAVADANLVAVIAAAGSDAHVAAIVGDVCRTRGLRMTALVIDAGQYDTGAVATTLTQLRPFASMIVIADSEIYIADMLQALQA